MFDREHKFNLAVWHSWQFLTLTLKDCENLAVMLKFGINFAFAVFVLVSITI